MWSLFERAKKVIFALALSVVPLALLYVQSVDSRIRHALVWPLTQATGIVESATLDFVGKVSDTLYKYFFVVDRAQELVELRVKLTRTGEIEQKLVQLQHENDSLRSLFSNVKNFAIEKKVEAKVIARAGYPMARVIRINKGKNHNIEPRYPVIGPNGVVGQVFSVAPSFSDVLLVSDASSSLDARIVGSQGRGLIRGKTGSKEYLMEMRDVDGLSKIRVGDNVVTTGINSYFPSGVPIGEVRSFKKSEDGLYISAEIKPFENVEHLEFVAVLLEDPMTPHKFESISASWPLAIK